MDWLNDAVLHGKYRVGQRLGEGGMGAVYLAEHVGIGRTVALKVIRPDLLTDSNAAERFVREARAAGSIQHRHVVNVTDFGVDRVAGHDVAYLVMEHLRGETLESVLEERRRLPLTQVVDIVEQVAAALAAAHARNVVHRDLKPANIWLTPDARGGFHVTLLDFGIAKLRDDGFAHRDSTPDHGTEPNTVAHGSASPTVSTTTSTTASTTATQVGESIGTPAYMSPEQCVGDDVDRRSDLYSLGVVVYQMLAGDLPFRGDTRALLRQHFVAEIPALPLDAGVPSEVEAVVRRALAKEPEGRFQSAPAFAAALRAHASGFGESMRRAIVVFAERMPELAVLGLCFAVPALISTALLILATAMPLLVQPFIWIALLLAPVMFATPLAMASIATIFGDLRERPFLTIQWRAVAAAVVDRASRIGPPSHQSMGTVALYVAWVRTAFVHYTETSRLSKGKAIHNMLMYVDRFRHGGVPSAPERLDAMARVMPTRAFATMAFAQLGALVLLPIIAVLATMGVMARLSVAPLSVLPLLALAVGVGFTAALFLQVFIALVDVMLYDLAFDMTQP